MQNAPATTAICATATRAADVPDPSTAPADEKHNSTSHFAPLTDKFAKFHFLTRGRVPTLFPQLLKLVKLMNNNKKHPQSVTITFPAESPDFFINFYC